MGCGLRLVALCALLAAARPAVGQQAIIDLEGTWGNETGCTSAAAGAPLGDDLVALTDTQFVMTGTICNLFSSATTPRGEIVLAICTAEGQPGTSNQSFMLTPGPDDTLLVEFGQLGALGSIGKCP